MRATNKRLTIIAVLLWPFCVFVAVTHATTHYVSSTGSASWASSTNINTPCSLATANSNAAAGDIVYLRGGTYNISGNGIAPGKSGSSHSNRIIFSAYTGETPTLVGQSGGSQGVYLNGNSYIKVYGITVNNCTHPLLITNGHYNEISNCTFTGFYDTASMDWVGSRVRSGSTYNHVHDCTFQNYGHFSSPDGNDEGVVFGVGIEESTTDNTHYNLIENNVFAHGGHHVVDMNGYQNVWRNNYIRNDAWSNYGGTLYGNRITFTAGDWPYVGRNLYEYNRIAYGSECADEEIGGSGGSWGSQYNIVRRNMFYQNYLYGMYITTYGSGVESHYDHVYHNVFWYNGWSPTGPSKSNWDAILSHGITFNETEGYVTNNSIKNNIFYNNRNQCNSTRPIVNQHCNVPTLQTLANNWLEEGDPKFVNISGTPDPTNKTQFDFHLQSNSPCINKGGFLTTITSSSGSGTSFTVEDAGYFFDGWTMAANIPTATISGDIIQLQDQTATATITNVNYSTKTITVNTSLTWTNGQGISLAYGGSAPDIGAYEYAGSQAPSAPRNLRIIN